MKSTITTYILAGGQSCRMGQDKRWLQWRGRKLLDIAIELVKEAAGVSPILVGDTFSDSSYRDCRIIPDAAKQKGPLGGLVAALRDCQAVTESSMSRGGTRQYTNNQSMPIEKLSGTETRQHSNSLSSAGIRQHQSAGIRQHQSAGIRQHLKSSSDSAEASLREENPTYEDSRVLILPVDMPMLGVEDLHKITTPGNEFPGYKPAVRQLPDAFVEHEVAVFTVDGRINPLPMIVQVKTLPVWESLLQRNELKLRSGFAALQVYQVEYSSHRERLLNVNRLADLPD